MVTFRFLVLLFPEYGRQKTPPASVFIQGQKLLSYKKSIPQLFHQVYNETLFIFPDIPRIHFFK